MSTGIGIVIIVLAAIFLFRVTAFAARAALAVVALIGLLIIVVPLLMLA